MGDIVLLGILLLFLRVVIALGLATLITWGISLVFVIPFVPVLILITIILALFI